MTPRSFNGTRVIKSPDFAKSSEKNSTPANAPLFVAAHIAIDLQTLNRHKNELHVTAVALGYWYNADMGYAATDRKHEHIMTKKDAQDNGMPFYPSLPTDEALKKSEHAANIKKWFEKVH